MLSLVWLDVVNNLLSKEVGWKVHAQSRRARLSNNVDYRTMAPVEKIDEAILAPPLTL